MDHGKCKNNPTSNVRIKSIIVVDHKECLKLMQKKEVANKHRSKKKKKVPKRNLRERMLPNEGEDMTNSEIKTYMSQEHASSSERGLQPSNPSNVEQ